LREKNEDKDKSDIEFFFEKNGLAGSYADFPKDSLKQGFICLSESTLIDIFWAHPATKTFTQHILSALGQEGSTKKAAKEFVLHHKALFINELFGHGQFRHASLQEDQLATHYKLKGTVVTNGHVLDMLAYDTKYHRPTAAQEERRKGRTDIRVEFWELEGEGEEDDTSDQDDITDTVQQLTIQAPFLDDDDMEEGSSNTQLRHEAAASSMAHVSGPGTSARQVNWKQRSK
ncbi:hypothetical protein BGZ67_001049, partial [Mortierella alpina]